MDLNTIPLQIKRIIFYSGLCLSLIWVGGLFFALRSASVGNSVEKTGQMGDTFGIVTSLVACFALLGAIFSSLLQMHQLEFERAKIRREQELRNLELIALAFYDIALKIGELVTYNSDMSLNQTEEEKKLPLSLTREEQSKIYFSVISLYAKVETLVLAHCDKLTTELKALDKSLNINSGDQTISTRGHFLEAYSAIATNAEAGRNKAISLIRDLYLLPTI